MKGCPPLTPKQIRLSLRALRGRYSLRDRALVILGIRTGLRISELLSLSVGQVHNGQEVRERVYLKRSETKGSRQGASIIIHPQAAEALRRWIQSREPVYADDWLFPSQRCSGHPLHRHAAWRILHRAFLRAGVEGICGTHCLRKTYAAKVYRALDRDLFRLTKALRHASPLTSLAYLSCGQAEIDAAILRA